MLSAPYLSYVGHQRSATFINPFYSPFKPSNIGRLNLFTKMTDMKIKDKTQVPSQKPLSSGSRWQAGCHELETGQSLHRPDRLLLCIRTVVRGTPALTTTLRRVQTSSKYLYTPFLKLGNEAGRWCMPLLGKQCGFMEAGLSIETLSHIHEQAQICKASWIPGVVQLAPSPSFGLWTF